MLKISFYQIDDADLNDVVVMLVKKTRALDKKIVLYCPKPASEAIDNALWSHDAGSWLPHGLDLADGANLAPIWISSDMAENPIAAEFMILLHGAVPIKWEGFERAFVVFDGKSDTQLQQARSQWKQWKAQPEIEINYFSQVAGGKWNEIA